MRLDAVIFGGGVAGLWTLDKLSRQGCAAVLLESKSLGFGQTVGSQGIIHGGLKYSLQGWLTRSAQQVKLMPDIWRRCLLGQSAPNLTNTRLRSPACYLWQTESLMSTAGMLGARLGLQVTPEPVSTAERPDALSQVRGNVTRLPEQVIHPTTFLADLANQYQDRILKIDADHGLKFEISSPGEVTAIFLTNPLKQNVLRLQPAQVLFTAGAGNARLRQMVGLTTEVMQRRPLHMALVRGDLPELNGHCIDGLKTRATITSDCDEQGRRVWQVGGQLAEDGVRLTPMQLTQHAASELLAILPGLNLANTEWSTYQIDRAEGVTEGGVRPETVQVLCAGNVTTGWPTKLALAPVLADDMASRVEASRHTAGFSYATLADWPRPQIAEYPWMESDRTWWTVDLPGTVTQPPGNQRAA